MDSSLARRLSFGSVVLGTLHGAPNVVQAQHTTAPPVKSWATWIGNTPGRGDVIWVENGDSLPVVITKMRLSNCVNVQIPCRDATPVVKILASKEHSMVAVIPAQDSTRGVSYKLGLDWRVATECKGVAPRLPDDLISGALTPAKPISIRFPSGPYADKWPGGTYVRFYVAADGTTDSTRPRLLARTIPRHHGGGDLQRLPLQSSSFPRLSGRVLYRAGDIRQQGDAEAQRI